MKKDWGTVIVHAVAGLRSRNFQPERWGGNPIVDIETEFSRIPANQAYFRIGHQTLAAHLHELCEACCASGVGH